MTHYETLGVQRTSTDEQIKIAYRKMSMAWHPDRHRQSPPEKQTEAEIMSRKVNAAYAAIKNAEARASYDLVLKMERASEKAPQKSHSRTYRDAAPRTAKTKKPEGYGSNTAHQRRQAEANQRANQQKPYSWTNNFKKSNKAHNFLNTPIEDITSDDLNIDNNLLAKMWRQGASGAHVRYTARFFDIIDRRPDLRTNEKLQIFALNSVLYKQKPRLLSMLLNVEPNAMRESALKRFLPACSRVIAQLQQAPEANKKRLYNIHNTLSTIVTFRPDLADHFAQLAQREFFLTKLNSRQTLNSEVLPLFTAIIHHARDVFDAGHMEMFINSIENREAPIITNKDLHYINAVIHANPQSAQGALSKAIEWSLNDITDAPLNIITKYSPHTFNAEWVSYYAMELQKKSMSKERHQQIGHVINNIVKVRPDLKSVALFYSNNQQKQRPAKRRGFFG